MVREAGLRDSDETASREADSPPNSHSHIEFRIENVPAGPYPELPSVLERLVSGARLGLEDNLVGVYLVGSLAVGDFDLDSDVDFLVVTRRDITDEEVGSLQEMHARIYDLDCYPARHLEGSYISLRLLGEPEAVGTQPLWYLDNGSTTLELSTHDNQWHVRWVLRERGVTLAGPKASSLLDPVPDQAIRKEVFTTMRIAADSFASEIDGPLAFFNTRFGQSFAVLNYCRMLLTIRTGTVQSKLAGARWAERSLDAAWTGLIRRAWEERAGVRHCMKIRQRADAQDLKETLEFIRYMVREGGRSLEERFQTGDV